MVADICTEGFCNQTVGQNTSFLLLFQKIFVSFFLSMLLKLFLVPFGYTWYLFWGYFDSNWFHKVPWLQNTLNFSQTHEKSMSRSSLRITSLADLDVTDASSKVIFVECHLPHVTNSRMLLDLRTIHGHPFSAILHRIAGQGFSPNQWYLADPGKPGAILEAQSLSVGYLPHKYSPYSTFNQCSF